MRSFTSERGGKIMKHTNYNYDIEKKKTESFDRSISGSLILLVGLFVKRISIWPVPEHYDEEEACKRHYAKGIVERYAERLGTEKMVEIVNNASAEQAIEELILHEIELREHELLHSRK
jgi:hypothetical protein